MSRDNIKVELTLMIGTRSIDEIEKKYNHTVLFRRNSLADFKPPTEIRLSVNDVLVILDCLKEILVFANDTHKS